MCINILTKVIAFSYYCFSQDEEDLRPLDSSASQVEEPPEESLHTLLVDTEPDSRFMVGSSNTGPGEFREEQERELELSSSTLLADDEA